MIICSHYLRFEDRLTGSHWLGNRMDLVFHNTRMGLFFTDNEIIKTNIAKAHQMLAEGGDRDRRNSLKSHDSWSPPLTLSLLSMLFGSPSWPWTCRPCLKRLSKAVRSWRCPDIKRTSSPASIQNSFRFDFWAKLVRNYYDSGTWPLRYLAPH